MILPEELKYHPLQVNQIPKHSALVAAYCDPSIAYSKNKGVAIKALKLGKY